MIAVTIHGASRQWVVGWLGLIPLALVNGVLRAVVLQPVVGEVVARRISAVTLIVLVVAYASGFHRRWPLDRSRTAWAVGGWWVALTVAFEFGFGRYVEHLSWSTMLGDYDVSSGRLWPLVLMSIAIIPALVQRFDRLGGDPQDQAPGFAPRSTDRSQNHEHGG